MTFQTPTKAFSTLTIFSFAASIFMAGYTFAGTITVSVLSDAETDIVNTGQPLVSAANFGSSTVDTNGITHPAASAAANGDGADLISELTINSTYDGFYRGGPFGGGYTGNMETLMGGIAGVSSGSVELDISGLTIGQKYLFQGYWEAQGSVPATVTFEGTDSQAGISGGTAINGVLGNADGALISYAFTAGDEVLDADLLGDTGGIWWQGYSLQEVPEPSTAILAGLGLMGVCFRRRRN